MILSCLFFLAKLLLKVLKSSFLLLSELDHVFEFIFFCVELSKLYVLLELYIFHPFDRLIRVLTVHLFAIILVVLFSFFYQFVFLLLLDAII